MPVAASPGGWNARALGSRVQDRPTTVWASLSDQSASYLLMILLVFLLERQPDAVNRQTPGQRTDPVVTSCEWWPEVRVVQMCTRNVHVDENEHKK